MAERKWIGAADAIAQVDTVEITAMGGTPSATLYILTINGDIVSVPGDTNVNTTAANLQVALAASTNPYFSSITWTVVSSVITATASSPGNPQIIVSSVSGGTGTIGPIINVTASSGPNDWDVARNWDAGIVPVTGDDVIIETSGVSITHGLDQSAVTLDSLIIRKDFTGRIGLKEHEFATTSDGGTSSPLKDEYRDQYLQIGATILSIGENFSGRPQLGSTLIKIDLGAVLSQVTVHETGGSAFEASKPAIQLLGTNVSNELFVRAGKASVGVAVGAFEVSTFSDIEIGADMNAGGVILGPGVTLTNWSQKSGTHFVNAADTITKMDMFGGICTSEGDYTVTTVNLGQGATYSPNHVKTAGVEIVTINFLSGATVNTTKSTKERTFTNVNLFSGAVIEADNSIVTITNLNLPSGDYELEIA